MRQGTVALFVQEEKKYTPLGVYTSLAPPPKTIVFYVHTPIPPCTRMILLFWG